MNKTYFNPGCALSLYKPELGEKIFTFLNKNYGQVVWHDICCHHDPKLDSGSLIITVCSGCDKRFETLYEGISTVSLWEILDRLDSFRFPVYTDMRVSVHDACPVREKPSVHNQMKERAASMPCEDVVVYCVSCIESMFIGGKTPHYLPDLLFGEDTQPQGYDTSEWHRQLEEYIDMH